MAADVAQPWPVDLDAGAATAAAGTATRPRRAGVVVVARAEAAAVTAAARGIAAHTPTAGPAADRTGVAAGGGVVLERHVVEDHRALVVDRPTRAEAAAAEVRVAPQRDTVLERQVVECSTPAPGEVKSSVAGAAEIGADEEQSHADEAALDRRPLPSIVTAVPIAGSAAAPYHPAHGLANGAVEYGLRY